MGIQAPLFFFFFPSNLQELINEALAAKAVREMYVCAELYRLFQNNSSEL